MVSEEQVAGASLVGAIPGVAMLVSILLTLCFSCVSVVHIYGQGLAAGLVIAAILSELYPIIDYYHGNDDQNRYYALIAMTGGFATGLLLMYLVQRMTNYSNYADDLNLSTDNIIFVTGANHKTVKREMDVIKTDMEKYAKVLQDGKGDRAVIDLQTRMLESSIARLRRSIQGHTKVLTQSHQHRIGENLTLLKQYFKAFEDDLLNFPKDDDEMTTTVHASSSEYYDRLFKRIEGATDVLGDLAEGDRTTPINNSFWLRPPLKRIFFNPRPKDRPNSKWGIAWTLKSSRPNSTVSSRKSGRRQTQRLNDTAESAHLAPGKLKGAIAPDNTPNDSPRSSTYQSGDQKALPPHSPYRSIAGASERTPLFLSADYRHRNQTPNSYIATVLINAVLEGFLMGITYIADQRAGYILAAATSLEMFSIGLLYSVEIRAGIPGTSALCGLMVAPPLTVVLGSIAGASIGAALSDEHPYLFIGFVCFGIVAIIFFVVHELLISVMENTTNRGFAISMWMFFGIWAVWTIDKLVPCPDEGCMMSEP